MSSDTKYSNARTVTPGRLHPRRELTLESTPRKNSAPERSSDPYNTSGSFDRTKNWARVGKR
jgi:hypothetical protein